MKADKNIPELRFPEFDGEWKLKRISDLGKFVGGGTPESNHIEYWQGSIPWISSSDVYEGNILDVNITRFITEDAIDESATKRIPEYSVLIVSRVGIGKFAVNKLEICTSQDFTNLIPFSDNSFFLAYFFSARQNRFLRLSQGTSIKGFTGEDIGNLKFYIPPLSEQHKIASFLSSVDQRIHLLTQKKEKLEQYKKGLMQRIFSQELRFKPALSEVEGDENGKDYPEWKYLKANTLFKNHTNKNHNGDLPILSASQEHGMILREDGGIKIQSSDKSVLSYKIVEKGDFVISLRSFQGGIDYSSIKGICSPAYTVLKNISAIYPVFYRYFFKKESFIKRLNIAVIGIRDGKQISFETFGDLKLPYPNIAEQQKIATFLSSLDDKITQVSTQLHLARKWKQGLLQKMFV